YYNFKQTPLVRGNDTWWIEKMEGKKELTPAEPLDDIHMPNGSILPVIISLGFFIAAFGAMYSPSNIVGDGKPWGIPVLVIGLVIAFGTMLIRSVKDDLGYHIPKEELLEEENKGGRAV